MSDLERVSCLAFAALVSAAANVLDRLLSRHGHADETMSAWR
jgi:hypothetical protein